MSGMNQLLIDAKPVNLVGTKKWKNCFEVRLIFFAKTFCLEKQPAFSVRHPGLDEVVTLFNIVDETRVVRFPI